MSRRLFPIRHSEGEAILVRMFDPRRHPLADWTIDGADSGELRETFHSIQCTWPGGRPLAMVMRRQVDIDVDGYDLLVLCVQSMRSTAITVRATVDGSPRVIVDRAPGIDAGQELEGKHRRATRISALEIELDRSRGAAGRGRPVLARRHRQRRARRPPRPRPAVSRRLARPAAARRCGAGRGRAAARPVLRRRRPGTSACARPGAHLGTGVRPPARRSPLVPGQRAVARHRPDHQQLPGAQRPPRRRAQHAPPLDRHRGDAPLRLRGPAGRRPGVDADRAAPRPGRRALRRLDAGLHERHARIELGDALLQRVPRRDQLHLRLGLGRIAADGRRQGAAGAGGVDQGDAVDPADADALPVRARQQPGDLLRVRRHRGQRGPGPALAVRRRLPGAVP